MANKNKKKPETPGNANADARSENPMTAPDARVCKMLCDAFMLFQGPIDDGKSCLERKSISIICKVLSHGGIMRCGRVLLRRRRMLLRRLVQVLRRHIRPLACAVSGRPFFFHAKFEHLEQSVSKNDQRVRDISDLTLELIMSHLHFSQYSCACLNASMSRSSQLRKRCLRRRYRICSVATVID